ncbi:AVAST type 2 anti-phage system protein Avs2 [Labilibacter marinus]|uniref:AVAST type 2 anti-phage system protein Avs2 n=1 Tax=Labilibacter marinus TaxID=1477105 RepID=UPI0018E98DDA|nr:AVAST type 2 anti-phage system protein Avs2 [Labilibacter marinus]
MDPISLTALTYVSLKFLDQFLKEEGYGRIKKWLFPTKKYCKQLPIVISNTIEEYERDYPIKSEGTKFPFFHSQLLFEEFNKHILLKTAYSNEQLILKLEKNPNIIVPSSKELNEFYDRLVSNINNDKLLKSLFIDEYYKSKIFDIDKTIINIEKKLSLLNEQIVFNPNNVWFKKQCEASILDLGKRYTPELNFKLEVSEIFEGIGRTEKFRKSFTEKIDNLIIAGKKVLKDIPQIKEHILLLEKFFDDILELYNKTTFSGIQALPLKEFQELIEDAQNITEIIQDFYQDEERKIQKEKKDYQFYHKYGYEIKNLREFDSILSSFSHFINGNAVKLANKPYLILDGEAGIGKSHLLGDVISIRTNVDHNSIFLLGQHFVSEEDPWTQIFKRLQVNSKSGDFLHKLNEFGRNSNKRVLIIIDAINEGKGKKCWLNFINSFVEEVKSYEWLGLVLSIRTSYKKLIFPQDRINSLGVIEQTLHGFRSVEYEASKLFFDNYNIEQPNIPLLHPEFQNPLFLKLFCDGLNKSGLTRIPDGLQGISSIINFFINSINIKLANPNRLDYSERINLVKKSIEKVVLYKVENKVRYVPYEKAYEIVEDTVSIFINTRGFLDELIKEGIFSLNLFWNPDKDPEDGIYLAYERFEDHLMAQFLIEKHPKLELEFETEGQLYEYIQDEHAININRGLIDAFSIQIPEVTGIDFFNFVPAFKDNYTIIESFVESLLWRKIETITDESRDYVNEHVSSYQGTYDFFWETILAITAIPKHYFNAYSLHNHLMQFSLADRDAGWSQSLKYKYSDESTVKRLIDWAWSNGDKSHISDESIKLSSITLAWFHTTTNRQLRDCATKALVSILQNRLHLIVELLELFEDVNDPYVYERLFAVAYGCSLRSSNSEDLSRLSEYIFTKIFKEKDEIYPHALLRDYARGVIEYANYKGCKLSFDISIVQPPYKSLFPDKLPSNEEIDNKYKIDYGSKGFKQHHAAQNKILSSMVTEYGRGICSYGDFGRYTFQSALSAWDVDENALSNLSVKWIFDKYGYDSKKHGKYDNDLDYYGRGGATIERIGKKYQWIALHEMVARVSDNFKKYESCSFNNDKEDPYVGPWEPTIRDIEPSIILSKTGIYSEDEFSNFWWENRNIFNWDCSNSEWVKNREELPLYENLVQVKDTDDVDWLVLKGNPEWAEPKKIGEEKWDYAHKRLWSHINGYLVSESDFDKFKNWACEQDFMGDWMPKTNERSELFNREYYWSPAYKYFETEYYGGIEEQDVNDRNTGEFICKVIVPTEDYGWSKEIDKSKDDSVGFLKPCKRLFEKMNLEYSTNEGEFRNANGELICFDTHVYNNTKSYFLIKKDSFVEFLEENKLRIVWSILGEKQIIGGRTFDDNYVGRLEVSGALYLNNDTIEGAINTKTS